MNVPQKARPGKSTSWEATFPYEPIGEKSRSFLQRVVFLVASHIIYTRGLLEPEYFKKRRIENVKLFVLRSVGKGERVIRELKGVMEAIEFGYLRDFIIMVADRDRVDMYEALEIHRMSIFYEQDKSRLVITSSKGEMVNVIKYTSVAQARKQFFHLIHRITAFGNVMGPLPKNICFFFKLTYYDEKTPANYEPYDFIADDELFHFPIKVEQLTLGRLDCQKHMITTSVRSVFMKSVNEMKTLMRNYSKTCASVSRDDTTISSSPNKTLLMLTEKTDEFSQDPAIAIQQYSNILKGTYPPNRDHSFESSGILKISELNSTIPSALELSNLQSSQSSTRSDPFESRDRSKKLKKRGVRWT